MSEERRSQGADVVTILYIVQQILELGPESHSRAGILLIKSTVGSAISAGPAPLTAEAAIATWTALSSRPGKVTTATLWLRKIIYTIGPVIAGADFSARFSLIVF